LASLMEKYGGLTTVHTVVETFYDRVLEVDDLADYFAETDMERLVAHQTKFISSLMGGPGEVSDQRLLEAHAALAIGEADFAMIAEILQQTLTDSGVANEDVVQLMGLVAAKKDLIVA